MREHNGMDTVLYPLYAKIKDRPIVVFGGGEIGQILAEVLFSKFNKNICFFIDNLPVKQKSGITLGEKFYYVYSLEAAIPLLLKDMVIIIASAFCSKEMYDEVLRHSIQNDVIMFTDTYEYEKAEEPQQKQIDSPVIRLYYYNSFFSSNFGDMLNQFLIPRIFSVPIQESRFEDCNMISVGSILQRFTKTDAKEIKSKVSVWGAGFMEPPLIPEENFYCDMIFYAVRGNLTKERVKQIFHKSGKKEAADFRLAVGDPGLLVSKCFKGVRKRRYQFGLIPHFVDYHSPYIDALACQYGEEMLLIDVTGKVEKIIEAICSCEVILSSSLHGLIVADSFGIPNLWVRFSDSVKGGNYKFLDYYSVFGLEKTIHVFDFRHDLLSLDLKNYIKERYLISSDQVAAIQNDLLESFPFSKRKIEDALVDVGALSQRGINTWTKYHKYGFEKRIKFMLEMIKDLPFGSVMDLGCGDGSAKQYLPAGVEYIPVNYMNQYSGTVICDFNKGEFCQRKVDLMFGSGILEYIYQPLPFLQKIFDYCRKYFLLSYIPYEYRKEHPSKWVNFLTCDELRTLLKQVGFELICEEWYLQNYQKIFLLHKNNKERGESVCIPK